MRSQLHEALLLLFRNRPTLAPELMRDALHFDLPAFTEARIDSAELTEVKPVEYRADLVVLLLDGVPVYGIVLEAQLSRKPRKKFVWPVYATSLRARLELPVALLVVTADDATARWAAQPLDLGGGNVFKPLVLGPSGVPEIVDDAAAQADPELAVFSAIAHGRDEDANKAARIALAAHGATLFLDAERGRMYFDLVFDSLSEAAQKELRAMDPAKYVYRSDFAKQWIGVGREEGREEGRAEGELHGRAALLQRQLTHRFGPLPAEATEHLSTATIAELDAVGERLLTAATLEGALGPPPSPP
jgi:hypothetical protein